MFCEDDLGETTRGPWGEVGKCELFELSVVVDARAVIAVDACVTFAITCHCESERGDREFTEDDGEAGDSDRGGDRGRGGEGIVEEEGIVEVVVGVEIVGEEEVPVLALLVEVCVLLA